MKEIKGDDMILEDNMMPYSEIEDGTSQVKDIESQLTKSCN